MLWVDARKVEPVTQSFTSFLRLLADCDDRTERALICLLGQGIDNGVRIRSLSSDMLKDVGFRGPQWKITDCQGHIRVSFRVTMAVAGMEAGVHPVSMFVDVIDQNRHLGRARSLEDKWPEVVEVGRHSDLLAWHPSVFNLDRDEVWLCGSAPPTTLTSLHPICGQNFLMVSHGGVDTSWVTGNQLRLSSRHSRQKPQTARSQHKESHYSPSAGWPDSFPNGSRTGCTPRCARSTTRMPTFPASPQSSFCDAYPLVEMLSPHFSKDNQGS